MFLFIFYCFFCIVFFYCLGVNMKAGFCLFLVCAIGSICAESEEKSFAPISGHPMELKNISTHVKQSYGYFSVGLDSFPLPMPSFVGGYRAQSGYNGLDVSLQLKTVLSVNELKANLFYLHYFKPNRDSQFYVGGGVAPSCVFGLDYLFGLRPLISPELVLGKQYRNKRDKLRFFQIQIGFLPMSGSHLSYGFGF